MKAQELGQCPGLQIVSILSLTLYPGLCVSFPAINSPCALVNESELAEKSG